MAEGGQQFLRIPPDRAHRIPVEEPRENAFHRLPVFQQIRHAGRTPAIVLEHQIPPVLAADQVGSADMDIDVVRDVKADQFRTEMLRTVNDLGGDDAVLEDFLLVIDVAQEQIQRAQPLGESFFNERPLVAGNDPRNEVEWHDPLGAFVSAVNRECDPLVQVGFFGKNALPLELRGLQLREPFKELQVVGTDLPVLPEHLVKKWPRLVLLKNPPHPGFQPRKLVPPRKAENTKSVGFRFQGVPLENMRSSAEFRIDEPCGDRIAAGQSAHHGDVLLAEKLQRRGEQGARQSAVPVFVQDAGAAGKVVFRIGTGIENRCSNDARTMHQNQTGRLRKRKCGFEAGGNSLGQGTGDISPDRIHRKGAFDRLGDPFLFGFLRDTKHERFG